MSKDPGITINSKIFTIADFNGTKIWDSLLSFPWTAALGNGFGHTLSVLEWSSNPQHSKKTSPDPWAKRKEGSWNSVDHRRYALVTENVEEWLTCDSKGEALMGMVYQYGNAGIILKIYPSPFTGVHLRPFQSQRPGRPVKLLVRDQAIETISL